MNRRDAIRGRLEESYRHVRGQTDPTFQRHTSELAKPVTALLDAIAEELSILHDCQDAMFEAIKTRTEPYTAVTGRPLPEIFRWGAARHPFNAHTMPQIRQALGWGFSGAYYDAHIETHTCRGPGLCPWYPATEHK